MAHRRRRLTLRGRGRYAGCAAVAVLAALSDGCAGGAVAPLPPADASGPRVSWRVRSGPLGGDSDEICRSDAPGPCRLQASTAAEPRSVAVSVFLHPAGVPATYTGAVLVGFIDDGGTPGYEMNLRDYRLDSSDRPTAIAVAGPVTSQPGQYDFEIALLARLPGRLDPRQISSTIPVRVDIPPSSR